MTLYGKINFKDSDYFETKGFWENNIIHLNLKAPKKYIYTKSVPTIGEQLEKFLPGIFTSQCFNKNNFTINGKNNFHFKKECENTELGHLFEHVLLEYLCLEKISKGEKTYSFRGLTTWNWRIEEKGKFNIKIEFLYSNEKDILKSAFIRSLHLFEEILDGNITAEQAIPRPLGSN